MPPKPVALRAVRPNAGFEEAYAKKLCRLIDEMNRSCLYWIGAAYRSEPPEMAQDGSPASNLDRVIRGLVRRWSRRFDEAAKNLAEYFSKGAAERADSQLKRILREAGISVEFRMTRSVNDVVQASIAENVQLIRSIPQQYLTQVQGAVMRSVQSGRDLKSLTDDIQHQYGVTRRRAEFISCDQNNKATSAVHRARQVELGLQAQWLHSGGGKHPRPTHLKAGEDKAIYDPREGWYDPALGKRIWPGTEPNCRCVAKTVLPWRAT